MDAGPDRTRSTESDIVAAAHPEEGWGSDVAMFLNNFRASTSILFLPSYKEPTVNALAPRTDKGRG